MYAFDPSQGHRYTVAHRICEQLLGEDRLCLGTQVLQELYVTLTRKAGVAPEPALTIIDDLSQWSVMQIDVLAIRDAARMSNSYSISFWDALIVVAAERLHAAVVFTEYMNDGQKIGSIQNINPFSTGRGGCEFALP